MAGLYARPTSGMLGADLCRFWVKGMPISAPSENEILRTVTSVHGNSIRITARQWSHVIEAHDYVAGNLDKVAETLSEPTRVINVASGEVLALRDYESTNITRKTAVVVYRDEPDGFLITAYFTSKPEETERKGERIWPK